MRILIIEDEPDLAKVLSRNLESECFIVDTSLNGKEGSYMARTNDYDLIILDLMLPDKPGDQVCTEIRRDGKQTPIIIVSVKTEINTKVGLFKNGADDYITKPFSFEELLMRIRSILRRGQILGNKLLQIDNLVLDTDSHVARRGSKKIYLTRKEFSLLEYLMKHIGKVISRSQITEHAWDINADPFSHTIESHISNIRRKIDKGYKSKLLHTIPGKGYKIDLINQ